MGRFLLGAILALVLASPLAAQAPRSDAIESTIRRQMSAFEANDPQSAFRFASPMIRQMFGTAENFGTMVRKSYPMVWKPAAVRFLELRTIRGALYQKIMVTDEDGAIHFLDYEMVENSVGWQINGVQLLRGAQVGV